VRSFYYGVVIDRAKRSHIPPFFGGIPWFSKYSAPLFYNKFTFTARAWFQELQVCYDALTKSGHDQAANKIASVFSDWAKGPNRVIDFLHTKDMSSTVHPLVPQMMLYKLESTYLENAKYCEVFMTPKLGPSRFDKILESLLGWIGSLTIRKSALALLSFSNGEKITQDLIDLLPVDLLKRESFIKQQDLKIFVKELLFHHKVKVHLKHLLNMNAEDSKALLIKAYRIVRPYQIHFSGLESNNQVYPFINYSSEKYFRDPKLSICVGNLIDQIKSVDASGMKPLEVYNTIKPIFQKTCPGRSIGELQALLAIEDRMNGWMLPLTIKKSQGYGTEVELKYFLKLANVVRSPGVNQKVYNLVKNYENWTFWHKSNLLNKAFNHFSAPLFIKCELEISKFPSQSKQSIIYLFGVFYQILDAEAKRRIYKMPLKPIIDDALKDLDSWDLALATPCG
jgi:hypothetical protein